jgi:secreted trypsin-like serine protease
MRSIWRGTMAAAWGLAVLGAQSGRSATRPPGGIVNGTPTSGFPAVAALLDDGGDLFCTAFLIRPSCLVTAAHCLTPVPPPPGSMAFFGSSLVTGEYSFLINVRDFEVNPSYDENDLPAHDVAVVSLVSATDIAPLATDSPGADNTSVTLVGFGYDAMFVAGIKRTATVLQIDADSVSITTDGSTSNTCGGDSGSPLLRDIGGTLEAIGVASGGDPQCNQFGVWERLSSDLAWIDAVADQICTAMQVGSGIFLDGFGSEDTGAWSATEPP